MKLKKPKFWDLKSPNFLAYLLYPLTLPVRLNNILLKIINKKRFQEVKTICIGNIYLGGTGKTPTTLKLYELLKNLDKKVVTAKKFYSEQEDEQTILKDRSEFITANTRQEIVKKAIRNNHELIIFDDGLQDRKIDYDIKFVCFDCQNWIGNGCIIPSGPLREKIKSLKNYDGVFLKNLEKNHMSEEISLMIKTINSKIKVFNSYVNIKNIDNFDLSEKYLIFSGIGNSKSFVKLLTKNKFNIIKEITFPDHNKYEIDDIDKIIKIAKEIHAKIITTEKDFVKIPNDFKNSINFVKIDLMIENEGDLLKFIKSKIYETD